MLTERCFTSDLTIDKVFNEDAGILQILKGNKNSNKLFSAENVKIFRIFIKLVDRYVSKVAAYAERTIDARNEIDLGSQSETNYYFQLSGMFLVFGIAEHFID